METNNIDPICGMQGHIHVGNHRFCSQHCVHVYQEQGAIDRPDPKKVQQLTDGGNNKRIAYILIAIVVIGGGIAWFYKFMPEFMGGFFIIVSILKQIDLSGFAQAYSQYDIITRHRSVWGYIYPWIELILGVAYLFQRQLTLIAVITLVLMIIGTIGVALKLAENEHFRCACLGTKLNIPLTNLTLVEDLMMAAMAVMLIV